MDLHIHNQYMIHETDKTVVWSNVRSNMNETGIHEPRTINKKISDLFNHFTGVEDLHANVCDAIINNKD